MPRGYLTEDGPRPEFAELYGAAETSSASYPPRTRMNAQAGKPWLDEVPDTTRPSEVVAWIVDQGIR
jgi:hypothetical protein